MDIKAGKRPFNAQLYQMTNKTITALIQSPGVRPELISPILTGRFSISLASLNDKIVFCLCGKNVKIGRYLSRQMALTQVYQITNKSDRGAYTVIRPSKIYIQGSFDPLKLTFGGHMTLYDSHLGVMRPSKKISNGNPGQDIYLYICQFFGSFSLLIQEYQWVKLEKT